MQNMPDAVPRWTARPVQSRKSHKRHPWNNRPQQAEQSLMAWAKEYARGELSR